MPTEFVEVVPTASEWGRVRVHFENAPVNDDVRRDTRVQELGYIAFTSADIAGFAQYKFFELPTSDIIIDGFPCGLYNTGLFTLQGFMNYSPSGTNGSVHVGQGETVLVFDLTAWREAQVHVLAKDGLELYGEAMFEVSRELEDGTRHSSFFTFGRAPYVVRGLLPGAYGVKLYKPFPSGAYQQVDLRTEGLEGRRGHLVFAQ